MARLSSWSDLTAAGAVVYVRDPSNPSRPAVRLRGAKNAGVAGMEPMRVVSWNVNGIRACVRRGFVDFLDRSGANIVGVQEVRALPEEIPSASRTQPDWHAVFNGSRAQGV